MYINIKHMFLLQKLFFNKKKKKINIGKTILM